LTGTENIEGGGETPAGGTRGKGILFCQWLLHNIDVAVDIGRVYRRVQKSEEN
jgi:hypothetical protein